MELPCLGDAVGSWRKMESSLSVYRHDSSQNPGYIFRIWCRIITNNNRNSRQWYFWRVNMSPRRMPTVQVSSIVGISGIYPRTASGEGSSLMLIMAMASHGRRVSLLSCCLRGGGDWTSAVGKFSIFVKRAKKTRERPWSTTAIPCPRLECAEFSNQVDVHFVLQSPCLYKQFIPRDLYFYSWLIVFCRTTYHG